MRFFSLPYRPPFKADNGQWFLMVIRNTQKQTKKTLHYFECHCIFILTFHDGDKTMSLQHPADFKRCFYDHVYQHYPSMRAWAKTNGFNHNHVSMLLNGHCQGWRGETRRIRQAIEQIMGKPMPSGKKHHKK